MLHNIGNSFSKSFKEFFYNKQPKYIFVFLPISEFYVTHSNMGIGGKDNFKNQIEDMKCLENILWNLDYKAFLVLFGVLKLPFH